MEIQENGHRADGEERIRHAIRYYISNIKLPYPENIATVEHVKPSVNDPRTVFVPVPNYRETPPQPMIPLGMTGEAAKALLGWVYYADSSLWVGSVSHTGTRY